jgi:hypothetical protein
MSVSTKANNTLYFKAFNADYRVGGTYHSLGNSEFRCMVTLQAYSDGEGNVYGNLGKGLKKNELAAMVGLSGKTVELVMMNLESEGLVRVDDDTEIIHIINFVNDNVYRDHKDDKATRGRANLAKGQAKIIEQQAERNRLQDESNRLMGEFIDESKKPGRLTLVTDGDGEIIADAIKGGK